MIQQNEFISYNNGSRISFSHILNLSVQDFMKAANIDNFYLIPGKIMENDVNDMQNYAETIIKTYVLKKVKKKHNNYLNVSHLKLIIDVVTRWNS